MRGLRCLPGRNHPAGLEERERVELFQADDPRELLYSLRDSGRHVVRQLLEGVVQEERDGRQLLPFLRGSRWAR